MRVSERTIKAIGAVATGDDGRAPYRTKAELIALFNESEGSFALTHGVDTTPARWKYAEACIRALNGTPALAALMETIVHPREFLDTRHDHANVVDGLNRFLDFDGYQIVAAGKSYKVRRLAAPHAVVVDLPLGSLHGATQSYVDEQIAKCDKKIAEDDFDGAITNARTLLEAVLTALETEFSEDPKPYDGDLIKLYKRVQAILGLDASRKDVSDTIKQILSGLSSIVSGLAGMRNKMSDAHVLSYRPARHHAVLAVNTTKTICSFLLETRNYQQGRGTLPPRSDS